MHATHPFKFSVVTVSYNQAEYLADNITSVLAQDYPNFEHIVVDGGSKDNSREVCERYEHVRFILAEGTTQSEALNIGFAEASGDIIAWLNSDDYYEPGAFHRVARKIDPARNCWIVAGAANVVDAQGHLMWVLRNGRVPFRRLLFHPRLYPYNGWTVMPCQPSVFFHKHVIDTIGLLDPGLRYGMDYEFWLRMLDHGFKFQYVPQIFSAYRYHATSHTSKGYDTFLGDWQEVSDRYYGKLGRIHRMALEAWWGYARVECVFVRQHKAAMKHMAERFQPDPRQHPLSSRIAVMLRAASVAPWILIALSWQGFCRQVVRARK